MTSSHLPILNLQPQNASLDVWDKKYRLKTKDGAIIDQTIAETYQRVALTLAALEKNPPEWQEHFLWALENGAIPGGRIIANAGAHTHKPATSTINCTVSGEIYDSMESILTRLKEAGLTLRSGSGIGYEFSTLRPRGAYVSGAGAQTSGPLSFMDIYDKMCFTISSAGGRRGAQMATFDISHPDILEFVRAKREAGRLRQFNLSVLVSDEFMATLEKNSKWPLVFNGKEYRHESAQKIWDIIMRSTYEYAEPGIIFIDTVNKMNNLWWCENIRATNPCGEIPLPQYGSCLLGSINLTNFVRNPFADDATFDYEQYRQVIRIFTRMLDNVVEINGLPLPEQRNEIARKRRHGMGYLGLGSAMTMLKMKYGSKESLKFTHQVTHELALAGWRAGIELAKEKGSAPILEEYFEIDGKKKIGKELLINSKYLQQLAPKILEDIKDHGCRFTHHSAIAPTGTISLALANNASNGIEPSFAHSYSRNIIKEGKKTKEQVEVYSYEYLLFREKFGPNAPLPDYFITANDIDPKRHIDVQAAAQYWIDSSISKTINVPSDYPFEQFEELYRYGYEKGLKGCTTFRYNPEQFSGVLVQEKDLEKTLYRFTLEDGAVVEIKGNEEVNYDGETHTAANLYDALKEGYYGRF